MTALAHFTKVFAVQQCKISPVTTDAAGGATAYGSSVVVPGTKALKVTGTVANVDLWGDNTYLDSDTMLKSVDVELDHAKLSFDLLNAMLGGAITDAGTTPNRTTTWNLSNPPTFGYFKIEARAAGVDVTGGDLHIVLAKVKLADFPQVGLAEENYQMFNLKCKAVPPLGTTPWLSIVENETAVTIT